MAQAQVRFRRRLLGYDRSAVHAALMATEDQLRRAETRRDELIAGSANVERIGAQVADMLRSLADRAVELEDDAASRAAHVVEVAHLEAEQMRAQAAAVLASAQAEAAQLLETARQQQVTIAERRETALISLQIAIDQMGRLATTVDQIDLTAAEAVAPTVPPPPGAVGAPEPETVVLLPWSSAAAEPVAREGADRPGKDALASWAPSI